MGLRYFMLLLMLFHFQLMHGKDKPHVLNGNIKVKGGDSYPYQLVFDVAGTKIKGYSVTKLPDGTEAKTSIKGVISKLQHMIIFSETKMLSAPLKDATACLVSSVLQYRIKGNNYSIAGPFRGKDEDQKECGNGTIEFSIPITEDSLYRLDTATSVKPDLIANKEPLADSNKITTGVQKQFYWHTDTCIIDIWDGGVIDGDVISILVNDQKALTSYTLTKEKKQLKLLLKKKLNTITIVAEDIGFSPPNTAQIILYDGNVQYRITAFNNKGDKADIIISK